MESEPARVQAPPRKRPGVVRRWRSSRPLSSAGWWTGRAGRRPF